MLPRELARPMRVGSAGIAVTQTSTSRTSRRTSAVPPFSPLSQNQLPMKSLGLPSLRSLPSSATPSRQSISASGSCQPTPRTPGTQDEKVRVAVRCRPPNPTQGEQNSDVIVSMDPESNQVFLSDQESSPWSVDIPVWSCNGQARDGSRPVSQATIYDSLGRPLLLHALDGYNSTLMAYGQTGSGKTYTMMGDCKDGDVGEEAGIVPRLCRDLFVELANRTHTGPSGERISWEVHVRYVEVYCEKICDLLNSGAAVGIREEITPHSATFALVGARRIAVTTTEDLLQALTMGNRWRRTAATKANDRSSRSHAIFSVELTEMIAFDELDGTVATAPSKSLTIRLVDLAGSERVSETGVHGTQLKEAKDINLSLFTLGCVIECLSDAKRRGIKPPYRDSVLTKLLRDAFGGNSKTTMICTIGPCEAHRAQTMQTLQYAAKARRVLNKPRVKEDPSALELRRANEELLALRQQLEVARRNGQHYGSIEAELREANARLRHEQKDAQLRKQVMEKREAELAARLRELEDQRESYEAQMHALEVDAERARTQQEKRERELRRAQELADSYARKRLSELEDQRIVAEAALRGKEEELLRSQRAIEDKIKAVEVSSRCRIDELQRQQKNLETALREKERMASLQERELRKKHKLAEAEAKVMERRAFDMEEEWAAKVKALEEAAKQREEEVAQRAREAQGALCKAEAAARRKEEEMQQKWRDADNEARRLQSEVAAKEAELGRRVLEANRLAQQRESELNERLRNAEYELNRRERQSAQHQVEVESLRQAAAQQSESTLAKQRTMEEQHVLRTEQLHALEEQLKAREAELNKQFGDVVQMQKDWHQQRHHQQDKIQAEHEAGLREVTQRNTELAQRDVALRKENDELASKLRAQAMQLEKQQMDLLAQKNEFETAMQRERHALLRTREELQLAQDNHDTARMIAQTRLQDREMELREQRAEMEANYYAREAAVRQKEAAAAAMQDAAATKEVELFQLQERLKTEQVELRRRASEAGLERGRLHTDLITSLQKFEMCLNGTEAGRRLEAMDEAQMSAQSGATQSATSLTDAETLNRREQRYFAACESMYRGSIINEAEIEFRSLVRQNQLELRDLQRCMQLAEAGEKAGMLQMQLDAVVGERKAMETRATNAGEQVATLVTELEALRQESVEVKVQLGTALSAAKVAEAQVRQLRIDAHEAASKQREREHECQAAVAAAERELDTAQRGCSSAVDAATRILFFCEEEQRSLIEHHYTHELQSLQLLRISDRRVLDREGTIHKWQSLYRRRSEADVSAKVHGDDMARLRRVDSEAQGLKSIAYREETLMKREQCLAAECERFEQRVCDFESYARTQNMETARQREEMRKYLLELEEMDQRKMREYALREQQLVQMVERLQLRKSQIRTNAQDMFASLLQRSFEQQSALADAHEELQRVSVQRVKYLEQERELLQRVQQGNPTAMAELLRLHEAYVESEEKQLRRRAHKLEKEEAETKQRLAEQEAEIQRYLLEIEEEDIRRNALSQQGQELMREAEERLSKVHFKEAGMRDLARQLHIDAMEAEENSRGAETKIRRAEQENRKHMKVRKVELERRQRAANTAAEENERTLFDMETNLNTIVNKNKDTEHHIQTRDAEIKRQKRYYMDLSKMLEERDEMLRKEHNLRLCGKKNAGSLAKDLLDVNDSLRKQVDTWKHKFDVLLHDGKIECEKCSWQNKRDAATCLCCGYTGVLDLTHVR